MGELRAAQTELRDIERRRPGYPEMPQTLLNSREQLAKRVEKLRCFDNREYMIRAHAERDRAGALLAWLANPTR